MKEWYPSKNLMIFVAGPKEESLFSFELFPALTYTKFMYEHTISFSWLFWEIGISYEKDERFRYY
jgi:hypothetical protein